MSKIYIGMITSAGNAENLEWLNMASKYVDGLAIVWHGHRDAGFDTVNNNKGSGFVIERQFFQHHSHSMNDFLLNPSIRPGDWILLRDSCERLSTQFVENIRDFVGKLELSGINSIFHYSKLFLFKKFEHQTFQGSPHWGLQRPMEKFAALEQIFPKNHEEYSYSVRNTTRPKDHWIEHFLKYYLYDSSNHLLLGRENNMEEFYKHEERRIGFKKYLESIGILLDVKSVRHFFENIENYNLDTLNKTLDNFINFEPILNDYYCYYILKHSHDEVSQRRQKKEIFFIE